MSPQRCCCLDQHQGNTPRTPTTGLCWRSKWATRRKRRCLSLPRRRSSLWGHTITRGSSECASQGSLQEPNYYVAPALPCPARTLTSTTDATPSAWTLVGSAPAVVRGDHGVIGQFNELSTKLHRSSLHPIIRRIQMQDIMN